METYKRRVPSSMTVFTKLELLTVDERKSIPHNDAVTSAQYSKLVRKNHCPVFLHHKSLADSLKHKWKSVLYSPSFKFAQ
jgi:hypothetical protein